MLSKWPIRLKLLLGLGLLVLVVGILSSSGLYTMYAYRDLVKSLSWRVSELPVAAELSQQVGDLRITLSELQGLRNNDLRRFPDTAANEAPLWVPMVRQHFRVELDEVDDTLSQYRGLLEQHRQTDSCMADNQPEWETVEKIETALARVHAANTDGDWMFDDAKIARLNAELIKLQSLTAELPSHLHGKLGGFAHEVRGQYRTLIIGTWVTSVSAALIFALFIRLAWQWILAPLRILVHGSRIVASGQFSYRIHLDSQDEMAELAEALNDMTARFQAIRDDLDRQVQERTKQVVRSEQLASVGFLAAGVAHEINNPLASIAMCAESLESRLGQVLGQAEQEPQGSGSRVQDPGFQVPADNQVLNPEPRTLNPLPPSASPLVADAEIIRNYLRMIQEEAFRCKEITEKLLDFSRIGPGKRQNADLGELVQGVIDMVRHLGKYQQKQIEFARDQAVIVPVNPQEIKQVVLNLLTNALDSLDDAGTVRLELRRREGCAELTVADDGCGMEPAVLEHVFEPFFTRRRKGQGTGLGLSITYRIVADHGGTIEAQSPGAGRGATFRVRLPLSETQKRQTQRQAA